MRRRVHCAVTRAPWRLGAHLLCEYDLAAEAARDGEPDGKVKHVLLLLTRLLELIKGVIVNLRARTRTCTCTCTPRHRGIAALRISRVERALGGPAIFFYSCVDERAEGLGVASSAHNHVARGACETRFARALKRQRRILIPPLVEDVQQVVAHLANHLVTHAVAVRHDDIDRVLWRRRIPPLKAAVQRAGRRAQMPRPARNGHARARPQPRGRASPHQRAIVARAARRRAAPVEFYSERAVYTVDSLFVTSRRWS